MIITDTLLKKRAEQGNPIKVGVVGAGAMARGVALQLIKYCQGFHLAAVSNRSIDRAKDLYQAAGVVDIREPRSQTELDKYINNGQFSVLSNPSLLCRSTEIDVVVEITGSVDFGARVVLDAIEHNKHIVLMNAELDGTIGPILKVKADQKGLVFTNVDGDQPGVLMNLYRNVKGMGIKPVLCGNIKGLQDPYRTPETQRSFAERWNQNAPMVTSFADGTKISFEQALVANATGMKVATRGMTGPTVANGEHINNAPDWFPYDLKNQSTGIVDYVVGASPAPGVFVIGTHDDPHQQHFLEMYKLGKGPFYTFYTPYHLCHFEVQNTIARAVLLNDATIAPDYGSCVDVIATAKRTLKAGEVIDGIGHFMTYGQCENATTTFQDKLLPMGLAQGCILNKDIPKDQTLTLTDVSLPGHRMADLLRDEQNEYFFNGGPST